MKARFLFLILGVILSACWSGETFAQSAKEGAKPSVTKESPTPKESAKESLKEKEKSEKEASKERLKDTEKSVSPIVDDETGSEVQKDENEDVDPIEKDREKQKAIDDVNAFLIESYKIKLDKLLDEVYRSVRVAAKDDPALQTLLLKRVLSEIETKMQSVSDRNITPNRKKILLAVFSYLKSDIESKIRAFAEK